jgi:hypothetical protein
MEVTKIRDGFNYLKQTTERIISRLSDRGFQCNNPSFDVENLDIAELEARLNMQCSNVDRSVIRGADAACFATDILALVSAMQKVPDTTLEQMTKEQYQEGIFKTKNCLDWLDLRTAELLRKNPKASVEQLSQMTLPDADKTSYGWLWWMAIAGVIIVLLLVYYLVKPAEGFVPKIRELTDKVLRAVKLN